MKEPLKLNGKNLAGCHAVRVWPETDSLTGIIRFDLEGFDPFSTSVDDHVILEFPNLEGLDKAICRLSELRKLWINERKRLGQDIEVYEKGGLTYLREVGSSEDIEC